MRIVIFLLIFVSILSCKQNKIRDFETISIKTYQLDSTSIRALEIINQNSIVYAGSIGDVGIISDNGKKWSKLHVIKDTIIPHFRSIAYTKEAVFLLSIANPALLYKFSDNQFQLVYQEEHPKVFYDSMTFFDDLNGIAMGDPTDECLSVLLTSDGGSTWCKVGCEDLPNVSDGEAAFAASNSNLATYKDNVWLVTGGKKARVFHSNNKGIDWKVYDTPIVHGKTMTGIYSVDFYDENNGFIIGGDWENKTNNYANKAITTDGGRTWTLVSDGEEPGYKSCVQYVPNTKGKELFAVGTTGLSYSNDGGYQWKEVSKESFYTIRFADNKTAWLGGNQKIGKLILE